MGQAKSPFADIGPPNRQRLRGPARADPGVLDHT